MVQFGTSEFVQTPVHVGRFGTWPLWSRLSVGVPKYNFGRGRQGSLDLGRFPSSLGILTVLLDVLLSFLLRYHSHFDELHVGLDVRKQRFEGIQL